MLYTSEAPELWKLLNGIICVYKPQGLTNFFVRRILIGNIANDLNELHCRPPVEKVFTKIRRSGEVTKYVRPSFADDVLVVGPRYLPSDVRCAWVSYLGKQTSGVLVLGINKGNLMSKRLHDSQPVRVYHVAGKLGIATDTCDIHGAVVERSSFKHVTRSIIDRVLASMQAAHQKRTFDHMGVHLQSQAAYELAVKGTVRPSSGEIPFLYSMKCIEFSPPDFTIEIKCVNEYEEYLKTVIHDVGVEVHATAACSGIRCIRLGPFTVEHALLRRHWHLQSLFDNLSLCQKILNKNASLVYETPSSLTLAENNKNLLKECVNNFDKTVNKE